MWLVGWIREGLENIPQELGRYVGKSENNISAKTSLSNQLHSNILTPGNIPEFCLPPRLTRSQGTAALPGSPRINLDPSGSPPRTPHVPLTENTQAGSGAEAQKGPKPLPFSAEGYGLAGMHESANTRRKESLFHSSHPVLTLDRSLPSLRATTRVAPERTLPKTNIQSKLTISFKSLSETGSTESDTPSSNDSTPLSSPLLTRSCSSPTLLLEGIEEGATLLLSPGHSRGLPPQGSPLSCLFFTPRQNRRRRGVSPQPFPHTHHPIPNPGSLVPPLLFPLDVLHRQERPQRERVLPLTGRGVVRLSAERTPSPVDSSLSTVRIHIVSVENLRDEGNIRPLTCCLSLSLTPGKLQRQESAVIRNCRRPVFNEDFFFTDLSPDHLLGLELRVKVLDKTGHSALRKGAVLGVTNEPLAQLLPFE